MLRTIEINQSLFSKEKYKELDIVDVAIYESMKMRSIMPSTTQLSDGYCVISHKAIIEDLPLYKATTKEAVKRRINKLRKVGLVELSEKSRELGKSCYKINDIMEG